MILSRNLVISFLAMATAAEAFVAPRLDTAAAHPSTSSRLQQSATSTQSAELKAQKKKLLQLLGKEVKKDNVLADPITKEPIEIQSPGILLGDGPSRLSYDIQSPSNKFQGSSDTFINLLEPVKENEMTESRSSQPSMDEFLKQALPYVPVPLRAPLASLTGSEDYVPMRDLFTSPAVSYAYERGWRQGFAQAGFPGADVEASMAMDYFAPVVARNYNSSVVVDMSCATGLFTRRFAMADIYDRVLGCDYSESMLTEARRRINAEPKLSKLKKTSLDLVRLDVGSIPMQNETIDCLHAGAAMHCWPDLNAAASEIYRVLKPGGRYFATTFLAQYFSMLSNMDGAAGNAPSRQAFQYFASVDTLRDLLVRGGFEREKIQIEVLGNACVVIRAEK